MAHRPTGEPRALSTAQQEVHESELPKLDFRFADIEWTNREMIAPNHEYCSAAATIRFVCDGVPVKLIAERSSDAIGRSGSRREHHVYTIATDTPDHQRLQSSVSIDLKAELFADERDMRSGFSTTIRRFDRSDQGSPSTAMRILQDAGPTPEDVEADREQAARDVAAGLRLPRGTGLALYAKILDEVLPEIAAQSKNPTTHVVMEDLQWGDREISPQQWQNQFGPILRARAYQHRGSSWAKTYEGKNEGLHWPGLAAPRETVSRATEAESVDGLPRFHVDFEGLQWQKGPEQQEASGATKWAETAIMQCVFNGVPVEFQAARHISDQKNPASHSEHYFFTVVPAGTNALPEDSIAVSWRFDTRDWQSLEGDGSTGIERHNRGLSGNKKLPNGIGLAFYRELLEHIIPASLTGIEKPITHTVKRDLFYGDRKVPIAKWNEQFGPILEENGYTASEGGRLWKKTYKPPHEQEDPGQRLAIDFDSIEWKPFTGSFSAAETYGECETIFRGIPITISITQSEYPDKSDVPGSKEIVYDMTVSPTSDSGTLVEQNIGATCALKRRSGAWVVETSIHRHNEHATPEGKLPPGTGIALYKAMLDQLLPYIAEQQGVPIKHVVESRPSSIEKEFTREQWMEMFGPLLAQRDYKQSFPRAITFEKTYTPKRKS